MQNNVNFYDSVFEYVKGTTMAAWAFWLSAVILLIGINGFVEDTYSSYVGVQQIEQAFHVRPASWELTYWAMSLAFQVVTMIAMFGYLSNKKVYWWALWLAVGSQLVDFAADMWYRANGEFTGALPVFVSFILTFIFFTVGSEFAITFGLGLVARLLVEGLAQTGIIVRNIIAGIGKLAQILASGSTEGKGATHSNITNNYHDVKYQGGGKPNNWNNQGGGKQQNFNNQNQKPNWKPQQGGGGDAPKVNDAKEGISQEDLKDLYKLSSNSDGSAKSHQRGNPFRSGGNHS